MLRVDLDAMQVSLEETPDPTVRKVGRAAGTR